MSIDEGFPIVTHETPGAPLSLSRAGGPAVDHLQHRMQSTRAARCVYQFIASVAAHPSVSESLLRLLLCLGAQSARGRHATERRAY